MLCCYTHSIQKYKYYHKPVKTLRLDHLTYHYSAKFKFSRLRIISLQHLNTCWILSQFVQGETIDGKFSNCKSQLIQNSITIREKILNQPVQGGDNQRKTCSLQEFVNTRCLYKSSYYLLIQTSTFYYMNYFSFLLPPRCRPELCSLEEPADLQG